MEEGNLPTLTCEYYCSDQRTNFQQTLSGDTLDDLLCSFKCFLLACGFSEALIEDYLQTSLD